MASKIGEDPVVLIAAHDAGCGQARHVLGPRPGRHGLRDVNFQMLLGVLEVHRGPALGAVPPGNVDKILDALAVRHADQVD
eukprot:569768-Alexandrium_andersonii.AAC.1